MNKTNNPSHNGTDENKRKSTVLISGYSGTVPIKFRVPSTAEKEKFKSISPSDTLDDILKKTIIEADDVKTLCKSIYTNAAWDISTQLPTLLDKFPQFTPYVIDMFIKNENNIPDNICLEISSIFSQKLIPSSITPEYILMAIAKLLGTGKFCNSDVLLNFFINMRRNSGEYIGRIIIESLSNNCTRGQATNLKILFDRSNSWEKRALIRLLSEVLSDDEKAPWLKNVKILMRNDPFAIGFFDNSHNKTKKQSKAKNPSQT